MAYYITALLVLYPIWIIYKKIGINPAKSIIVFIPGGILICAFILANSEWKFHIGKDE